MTTVAAPIPISFLTTQPAFSQPKVIEKFVIDSDMKREASQRETEFMMDLRVTLREKLQQFAGISAENVDAYLTDETMIVWVRAFTHATYGVYNYENLENLGDKLVGAVITQILHEIFGETMTPKTFSDVSNYINSNVIFSRFIDAMGVYGKLRHDPNAQLYETAIKGDLFESFCAALFLVGGYVVGKGLDASDNVNCAGYDLLYNFVQFCLLDIMQIVVTNGDGTLRASKEILKASFGAPKSILLQMFAVNKTAKDIVNEFSTAISMDKYNVLQEVFDMEPKCLSPNAVAEVKNSTRAKGDIFINVFDTIFEFDEHFFAKYRKYENAKQIANALRADEILKTYAEHINEILQNSGFENFMVQKETNKMKMDTMYVRLTARFKATGNTLSIASSAGNQALDYHIKTMIRYLAGDVYTPLKRILKANVF